MKKKILCALLIVVVIATSALLFACDGNGGKKDANFDVPAGGYDGSEVTLKYVTY